jgi:hypothetical protein
MTAAAVQRTRYQGGKDHTRCIEAVSRPPDTGAGWFSHIVPRDVGGGSHGFRVVAARDAGGYETDLGWSNK